MNGAKRVFTYEEALAIFPRVRDLTAAAVQRLEGLTEEAGESGDAAPGGAAYETAYQEIVQAWFEEITALGCEVKGLWLVDWDNGDGYYCWRYPEEALCHFHTYEEGFAGRIPIN